MKRTSGGYVPHLESASVRLFYIYLYIRILNSLLRETE
ncbi:hypothetical protein M123_3626 [Bacteroides fragilis str. 3976T8]|uniref:Uncharacterized protein n=1 Tax=Bacteroides fragilis str. 3976T8 TaxID=1339314 RepID=A0A016BTD0_BACFG|nr:hypothetical protein M123_3626 [Bacteroides fragilis str. 3976T8]